MTLQTCAQPNEWHFPTNIVSLLQNKGSSEEKFKSLQRKTMSPTRLMLFIPLRSTGNPSV